MKKLICFGDSITARFEGWESPMMTTKVAAKLQDFEVYNAGVPGDNTNDAIARLEKDVLVHQPDLVTVLFGANDAAFHKTIDLLTYKENLLKIVKKIGARKTILISPALVDEKVQFARTNEELEKYATKVKQVAQETGCHLIDFFEAMLAQESYKEMLKGIEDDGLHFGEAGYDLLVRLIVDKIEKLAERV